MEQTKKRKIVYSGKEKLLRAVSFLGILLCEIIAVLLFIIGDTTAGIIVLAACVVSSFLVSSFFTGLVKKWFGDKKKKRLIFLGFYLLALIICMLTTYLVGDIATVPVEDLTADAIEYAQNSVKGDYVNIKIIETAVTTPFLVNDGYYYEIEIRYEITSTDGIVSTEYEFTYLKINKYTSKITEISWADYMNAQAVQ